MSNEGLSNKNAPYSYPSFLAMIVDKKWKIFAVALPVLVQWVMNYFLFISRLFFIRTMSIHVIVCVLPIYII